MSDIAREYEFTFLSRSRRVGLSYCNERVNLSEEKINFLKEITLVLLHFYPFLYGWVKGDGNQSLSFLKFLRETVTMYFY